MNNKRSSTFKISVDSDRPESLLKAKRENIQTDKLGQRITLVAILVLLIAGAAIFVAYADLLRRLNEADAVGKNKLDKEIGGISKELEEKLADLSQRYEKMDESIGNIGKSVANSVAPVDELLPILEKSVGSLKSDVTKAEQEVKSIGETVKKINDVKTDKKELTEAVEKFEKSFESLRQNMGKLDSDIAAIDEKFAKQISVLSELTKLPEIMKTLNEKVGKLESEVDTIKSGDIYRRVMDIAMKKQEKEFKQELDVVAGNLKIKDNEIRKLEDRINDMERSMNVPVIKRSLPKPTGTPQPGTPGPETSGPGTPQPGTMIEKDID